MIVPLLNADRVRFSYGGAPVLDGLSLAVAPGERVAILGPNGCGKTTLLKLLAGVLTPLAGRALLDGQDVGRLPRRAVAQRLAVVAQGLTLPFDFTAREVVALGRTAHAPPWPWSPGAAEGARRDVATVEWALGVTQVDHLAERPFHTLSGGERQLALVAMALAQSPAALLLDEPTTYLDLRHQVELLQLLCRLQVERELAIVAAMHDVNLAALYFPRLVLLSMGRVLVDGPPESVLAPDVIAAAYGAQVEVITHPRLGVPQVIPMLAPQCDASPRQGLDYAQPPAEAHVPA